MVTLILGLKSTPFDLLSANNDLTWTGRLFWDLDLNTKLSMWLEKKSVKNSVKK